MSNKRNAAKAAQAIEDKSFESLIRKYTKLRNWSMVQAMFLNYGQVLEDREKGLI